jgi:hypothetical protein
MNGYQVERISDLPTIYAVTDGSGFIYAQYDTIEAAERAAHLFDLEDEEDRFLAEEGAWADWPAHE